jgi:pyruvate formate lyase activating enzyme
MSSTNTDSIVPTKYWHRIDDGRIQCDLCPRLCKLRDGQRGMCFVRASREGQIVLTTYGRSSGFCIDPIEKKPLNHFFPGTPVLSFGTAGCNLACRFCQNWDISKSREIDILADRASPEVIARAAKQLGCRSVAFTYNDPVIFLEYAVDVAQACKESGIATVAVTAGEICDEPRAEFFRNIDAANVDLKAFTERFYRELCAGELQPVLDTLLYLKHETDVWFELTTLIIPGNWMK